MSHINLKYSKFNIPTFAVWNEATEPCLVLHLDPKISTYESLEYREENGQGTYAYSIDIEDLKNIRDQLIKVGRFKPTELTFGKILNIPAILKKRNLGNVR